MSILCFLLLAVLPPTDTTPVDPLVEAANGIAADKVLLTEAQGKEKAVKAQIDQLVIDQKKAMDALVSSQGTATAATTKLKDKLDADTHAMRLLLGPDPDAKQTDPSPPPKPVERPEANDVPTRRVLYWAHASWCVPCREMLPIIADLQSKGYEVHESLLESGTGDVNIEGQIIHVKSIPQIWIVAGHGADAAISWLPTGKHTEAKLLALLK